MSDPMDYIDPNVLNLFPELEDIMTTGIMWDIDTVTEISPQFETPSVCTSFQANPTYSTSFGTISTASISSHATPQVSTTSQDTPTAFQDTPTASQDTPTASQDTPTASQDIPTVSTTSFNLGVPRVEPLDQPVDLDSITDVIMHNGVMKYTTLKVFSDRTKQTFKYIMRAYFNEFRDAGLPLSKLPVKPDKSLLKEVVKEMSDRKVVCYDVIGQGRLFHSVEAKSVAFCEDQEQIPENFNGHSEQCYWARRLIDEGKFKQGYVTYHVMLNMALSPESKRRMTEQWKKKKFKHNTG